MDEFSSEASVAALIKTAVKRQLLVGDIFRSYLN